MAARDTNPMAMGPEQGDTEALDANTLGARLQEEINRAERHGTGLSCLLLTVEGLEAVAGERAGELREQTLAYIAAALARELRSFDRIGQASTEELAVVLPGADGPRGEVVARRLIERVRSIKLETDGERRPLQITLGLAAWSAKMAQEDLLARTRAATRPRNGNGEPSLPFQGPPIAAEPTGGGAGA